MTELADITEETHGDVVVAVVCGELDASNVGWAEARVRGMLTNRRTGLVVDLTQVSYLDSAGIALVFTLAGAVREHQQELALAVDLTSPIARMLKLTGVDRAVPIATERGDAVALLS